MNMRWRGRINWKDITERVIAGVIGGTVAGVAAGGTLFALQAVFQ